MVPQSEEDLALKEQLELYVVRAQDADPGVQKLALESMRYCPLRKSARFRSRVAWPQG
jgi:hypothetical protein